MIIKSLFIQGIKLTSILLVFIFSLVHFEENYSSPGIKIEGEKKYPQNFFRWPLDIPIQILGTFGELRPNHFHSGIDIKTQEREGIPTYAVADGYISRIRIQASGFGNALYITHPNGYVSVYGHLQRYNSTITAFIRKAQYQLETFEIDTLLPKDLLKVNKGEVVALTGNTGASEGPHLHFDIRDEKTEEPINFLLMHPVDDHIQPRIHAIYIYPLNAESSVNNQRTKVRLTEQNNHNINAYGEIGMGIICDDALDGATNRNGVYSVELKENGKRIFYSQMERFFFRDTRAINAHIDFSEKMTSGRSIQKSFLDEGDPLSIYSDVKNNGRIKLVPGKDYKFEYIVSDVTGNISSKFFEVHALENPPPTLPVKTEDLDTPQLYWNQNNMINQDQIKLNIPSRTLYKNTPFRLSATAGPVSSYSASYKVLSNLIPAHDYFDIAIKPNPGTPLSLYNKLVVILSGKGSCGGTLEDGFIKGRSRIFGSFYLAADINSPLIKPINILNGKNMSRNNGILVRIKDDLSGISSYRATIDGHWILMNYDQKYQLLSYYWDEYCKPGKHLFELEVSDNKNNISHYKANFSR